MNQILQQFLLKPFSSHAFFLTRNLFNSSCNSSVSLQYKPLGMKNGRIPSRAITVSSKWDIYHGPSRARLQIPQRGRYRGAWSARHNNQYQWIRIDFRRPVKVLAVASQGRSDASQWVTRYYLSYSFDGIHFVPYLCRKVSTVTGFPVLFPWQYACQALEKGGKGENRVRVERGKLEGSKEESSHFCSLTSRARARFLPVLPFSSACNACYFHEI